MKQRLNNSSSLTPVHNVLGLFRSAPVQLSSWQSISCFGLLATGLLLIQPNLALATCTGIGSASPYCTTAPGASPDSGNLTSQYGGPATATLQDWQVVNGGFYITSHGTGAPASPIIINTDSSSISGSFYGNGTLHIGTDGVGTINVTNSTIVHNSQLGHGIAIDAHSGATNNVSNSSITLTQSPGGSVVVSYVLGAGDAIANINNSTLTADTASSGGIYSWTANGNSLVTGTGGAISIVSGNGIYAAGTRNSTVNYSGNITLSTNIGTGVQAIGGQVISVTTAGSISGGAIGIDAYNTTPSATDVTVAANNVSSGTAILVDNQSTVGGSKLDVTTTGTIVGLTGNGIVTNAGGAATTTIAVNSGSVTGASIGIIATSNGNLQVATNGTVTGQVADGIRTVALGTATTTISQNAGAIKGATNGIEASGAGNLTVTANGSVTGTAGDGISSTASGTATTTIATGASSAIQGGANGINASGNAALQVTTNGAVTGLAADGIKTVATGTAITTISQNAGTIKGATNGIEASGAGNLTVTANGNVIGTAGDGIKTAASGTATTTITSAAGSSVMGGSNGINVTGAGDLSMTISGPVTGAAGDGISAALTGAAGAVITVNGNSAVTGGSDGIDVTAGSDVFLTTRSVVTGQSGDGIKTVVSNGGLTDIQVGFNSPVLGGTNGINVTGNGNLSLTVNSAVTGTTADGIKSLASNGATTDLQVNNASPVLGGVNGINVSGDAALNVTTNSAITGQSGDGIRTVASNGATTTLAAFAGPVLGGVNGINVAGDGALAVTVNAQTTGQSGDGIKTLASNAATTTLAVGLSGAVLGGQNGINASGDGNLNISTNSAITGQAADGIKTQAGGTATTTLVVGSLAPVSGGVDGISTTGNGDLNLTVNNNVTGTSGDGITTTATGTATTTLLVDGGSAVSGGDDGISMVGAGNINATANGNVSGSNGDGIKSLASNGASTTLSTASGVAVSGGQNGINLTGDGAILATIGGNVTGTAADGIVTVAGNGASTTLTTASGVAVSGGQNGISLSGDGAILATIGGNVTGTAADGIVTSASGTATTTLSISAASTVQGGHSGVNIAAASAPASISNDGTIQNLSGRTTDLAIMAAGGHAGTAQAPVSVTNNGLLVGTVDLAGPVANVMTNSASGIWNVAGGSNWLDSSNGGGLGLISNQGVINAVAQGATAAVTTSFSGVSQFDNAGLLTMKNNVAGDRTIINGNYKGSGGRVTLDTVLGNDASPSDRLVVNGDTSGHSLVSVTNVGGTGAPTNEGIEIITVSGASNGTFALVSDYSFHGQPAVVGGAYSYQLYKGNRSGSDAKDWFLRSELTNPIIPPDPDPKPGPGPDPVRPLYQPGAPSYEAYPQALLGLNGTATLQQRVGNRVWAGQGNRLIAEGADAIEPYAAPQEAGSHVDGNGVWGRIEGAHNRIEPRSSTSSTDYQQNVFKMQAGIDGKLAENEAGTLIGGVFVHYVHGKTKIGSVYGDGEIASDGYGFGGTLTWYGSEGFYIDAQAQASWYNSDLTSILARRSLVSGNDGFGYALSLESGQRLALDAAWSVTPQAQLSWNSVDFDRFTDTFGAVVSPDRGNSLQGRLGLTLDHETSWQNGNGLTDRAHVYGIANLYYEFLNGSKVDLAGVSFASRQDRLWGGLGLGGSYNWDNDKYSIYGEGLINTSLSNFGDSYSVRGNVGFRVRW